MIPSRPAHGTRALPIAFAIAMTLAAVACGGPHPTVPDVETEQAGVVRGYLDAFNREDVDTMISGVAPDIELFSVNDDQLSLDLVGRDLLRRTLADNFASPPEVRSTIEALIVSGPWVVVRERVEWTSDGEPSKRVAVKVFEVREQQIRRVWYYMPTG